MERQDRPHAVADELAQALAEFVGQTVTPELIERVKARVQQLYRERRSSGGGGWI